MVPWWHVAHACSSRHRRVPDASALLLPQNEPTASCKGPDDDECFTGSGNCPALAGHHGAGCIAKVVTTGCDAYGDAYDSRADVATLCHTRL